jgi:hypothetical protein
LLSNGQPHARFSPPGKETGRLHNNRVKSQEHRLMMDLIFVLAIVGFFGLSVAYAYAFDRI